MITVRLLIWQVTQGCPHLSSLDIGYCYRILKEGTTLVGVSAFPANLIELTLHGVQMSADLLTGLVDKLAYIKKLTLCGLKAVDDDTLEKVSKIIFKFPCRLGQSSNYFSTKFSSQIPIGQQWDQTC